MIAHIFMVVMVAMVIGQEPEVPAPPVPSEIAEQVEPEAAAPKVAPVVRRGPPEELTRLLQKLKDASPEQRAAVAEEIQNKYGVGTATPMVPGSDIDVSKYRELSEADQAKVIARDFVGELLAGNAAGAALHCGVPFMMEDHRIDHAEDVRAEWARHLRSKRTDLLALYDIEVLTPGEMEKRHGRPPPRLSGWNWRSSGTLVAVANISGHAIILLLRQYGVVWQVVGFHD